MFFCPAHHVRKRGRQLKEHGIRRTAWGGVLGMGFCLSVCVCACLCLDLFGFVCVIVFFSHRRLNFIGFALAPHAWV